VETCTVETGLLRKTACGHTAVTKCANCEQPLCTKHAIAQLNAGRKTGKFLCADCNAADRLFQETAPLPAAAPAKPAAAPLKPPPAPAAAKPAAEAPKPAEENSDGSIDFTPGKK
jgi:hypothetical protein